MTADPFATLPVTWQATQGDEAARDRSRRLIAEARRRNLWMETTQDPATGAISITVTGKPCPPQP